jgi:hypothetical protein
MGKTIEELVGELNGNTQQTTSKNKNNSMVDLANQLNGNMSKTDTETPVQRQQHIDQLMDQTFVKEPNALQQGWDFINKNIIQPVDNNIVKPVVGTSEKIGKGALAAVESVPSFFQEQFANLSKANNEMMIQGRIQELEHMDRVERKNKGLAMLPTSYYTSPEWRKHAVDSLERGNQSGLLQNASSNAEQSAQEAIKKQQQIKQNVGVQPGAGELAYNVVGGLEKIAPALATTAITKNPVPFLASTGLTSFSDTYANAKRNGMNDEQASSFATGTALTDTALNSIPLHQFLNPGVSVLKEMAKQGLTQQVIGDVSSLINYGIEKKVLNQNMSLGEAWKRLQETGLTPGVTGAIMGGFSSVSERNAYNSAIKKVENGQPLNKAEHEIYLKHTINPEIQSLSNNNQNFTPNTGAINSISPEAQNGPKTEPNISVADNTPNGQSPESPPGSKIINDVPKAQLEPSSNISMANDVQNQTGFSSVGDNLLNRVKNMTPEEMLDRAYRNPVSGMWNRLAYDEIRANPEAVKPIQMAIVANGMK